MVRRYRRPLGASPDLRKSTQLGSMSKFEIVCRSFGNESWTCSLLRKPVPPTHSHGSRCGSVTSINLSSDALCGV